MSAVAEEEISKRISKVNGNTIRAKMVTGTMMIGCLGMTMVGILGGLVRLMIGPVAGLGMMTTGVTGRMTGPGTCKTGGMRNSRVLRLRPDLRVLSRRRQTRMNPPGMSQQ